MDKQTIITSVIGAVGIILTVGVLIYQTNDIRSTLGSHIDSRFTSLENHITARFSDHDTNITGLSDTINKNTIEIAREDERLKVLDERLDNVERDIFTLEQHAERKKL